MIKAFIAHCEKLGLKNDAFNQCQTILNNKSPEELDIENANKINLQFKSYSLIVDELNHSEIRTRIELINHDVQIGYFDLDTDFNGEFLDEFFVIN